MGEAGGHDDRLILCEDMFLPVDRKFPGPVEDSDHGVSAGGVSADLLALVEGEQGKAHMVVLCQSFADDLPFEVLYLIFQAEYFRFGDVFHFDIHFFSFLFALLYKSQVRRRFASVFRAAVNYDSTVIRIMPERNDIYRARFLVLDQKECYTMLVKVLGLLC